jgi:hypothetical protein
LAAFYILGCKRHVRWTGSCTRYHEARPRCSSLGMGINQRMTGYHLNNFPSWDSRSDRLMFHELWSDPRLTEAQEWAWLPRAFD